ncbi:MAG: TIGR02597 family protein [Verrucomicrobiota bacterium]
MKSLSRLLPCLLALASLGCPGSLKSANYVGFLRIPCAANADTIVSVPFRDAPSYEGILSAPPSVDGETASLAVGDTPSWEKDEFVRTPSFVRFLSGSRTGSHYRILNNSSENVSIQIGTDTLTSVSAGDLFEIVSYWTLNSLFPPGSQTTIHESASVFASTRKTEVLLFDLNTNGIELAPNQVFFLTNGTWHRADEGFPEAGDTVIPPGAALIIRHPDTVTSTSFVVSQFVDQNPLSTTLRTRTDGGIDHTIAVSQPIAIQLQNLQLSGAGVFEESSSTSAGDRSDELLVYENALAIVNQKPSATYFRSGGAWLEDTGASFPNADDETIPPGVGIVIRKAATVDGAYHFWVNTPTY